MSEAAIPSVPTPPVVPAPAPLTVAGPPRGRAHEGAPDQSGEEPTQPVRIGSSDTTTAAPTGGEGTPTGPPASTAPNTPSAPDGPPDRTPDGTPPSSPPGVIRSKAATAALRAGAGFSSGWTLGDRLRSDLTSGLKKREDTSVPSITPFRWAAIAIGLLVIAPQLSATSYRYWSAIFVLIGYALFRTFRPIRPAEGEQGTVPLIIDTGIHMEVVLLTGIWASPFTFSLVPSILLIGFLKGSNAAVRMAVGVVCLISIAHVASVPSWEDGVRDAIAWLAVLVVVGLLSGYTRQVTRESARQQSVAFDRVSRLAEANALLYSLNRVAQTLPATLDMDEVMDSTIGRLHELIGFDDASLFVYEEADATWTRARPRGGPAFSAERSSELHPALRRAMSAPRAITLSNLVAGVAPGARSGIYAPLRARGNLVGLLAIETAEPQGFDPRGVELVNGLVEPLGIALDNARLFSRLRSIGADEERSRIARDLHDQIGQSLAGVAFGLDRAVKAAHRGDNVSGMLDELREELRGTVREVREALHDLRTDVTDTDDLGSVLALFLDRVQERTGLRVAYQRVGQGRLGLLQERELWQIAREAVRNVERHAHASTLDVVWRCDGDGAELVVVDDGKGFVRSEVRPDSYGLVGMRERAAVVGATLDVHGEPGRGTTVRVVVDGGGR